MAPHAPQTVNAKLVPTKNLEHNATLKTSRADETLYTVKCYWDKAPEQWQPNEAAVYNSDFYESGNFEPYDDEGNELDINYIEVKVPAGTYDIMTSFYGLKYNELFQAYVTDFSAYVIKQNVTVSGDMELKFDPATATNAYTFEPKTPEGELFCPSEYYVTEDWQFTLKKQGNITGGLSFDFIMLYKDQAILSHDSGYSCITYTDDSPVGALQSIPRMRLQGIGCQRRLYIYRPDKDFLGRGKRAPSLRSRRSETQRQQGIHERSVDLPQH